MLTDLREERDRITEAVLSLERMMVGGKRRGRPPAWMAEASKQTSGDAPKRRGRPPGSKNRKSAT